MSNSDFTRPEIVPEATPGAPEPEGNDLNSTILPPKPEVVVEPMPEWNKAVGIWGAAWDVHQFGIGAVFAIIAVLSLVALLRLRMARQSTNKRVISIVLHAFLVMYGTSRCLFLCIDAYHHRKRMPVAVSNVLWGIAQPCLIASYSLLFVVLRNAIRLKQRFQTWFNTRNIALVVVPHFLFVFGSELAISFAPRLKILTFVCQLLYALLSFLLSVNYSYVSVLIWNSMKTMRQSSNNQSTSNQMFRIFLACVGVALVGMIITLMQIYAMAGPYGVFSKTIYISAWPWYLFTTAMRLLEVTMAIILFGIARHQSSSSTVPARAPVPAKMAPRKAWTVSSTIATSTINDN